MQNQIGEAKAIFTRLAHFTQPHFNGKNFAEAILGSMVEQVLLNSSTREGLNKNEIQREIKDKLKLDFATYEIEPVLESLLKTNFLVEKKNKKFSLEVKHENELRRLTKEKEDTHARIFAKVQENIRTKYGLQNEEVDAVTEDLKTALAIFILWSGADSANLIYGTEQDKLKLINDAREKDISHFLPPRPKKIENIEKEEFINFLEVLSEGEKEYFQDILERSLEYFTITLDKKCEALIHRNFEGWRMFVDTNFVYNLFGFNSTYPQLMKESAEEVLKIGAKFKIKFYISPETIDEFENSVTRAKEFLKTHISDNLFELAEKYSGDNAVISAYFRERKEHNISPATFFSHIEHFTDVLKQYDIEENREYSTSMRDKPEFIAIARGMEQLGKDPAIAEHDAFHYLLTLKMREREKADKKFFTNKTWFLTYDHALPEFDRKKRGEGIIPFAMHVYQLRRLLRPLISRSDDFESVFIEFVARPLSRTPSQVPVSIAWDILARISYYEDKFGITEVADLASNILLNEHLIGELKRLSKQADSREETLKLIDSAIEERIGKKLEEARKETSSDVTENKEYQRLLTQNWTLKWVIAILLWGGQVITDIFYASEIMAGITSRLGSASAFYLFWLTNLILAFLILGIPIGRAKVLELVDHIKDLSERFKSIFPWK